MDHTDYKAVVKRLIESGQLTQEALDDVMGFTEDFMVSVNLAHDLFCSEEDCEYNREKEMPSPWRRESHKDWIRKARHLLAHMECEGPEEFFKLVGSARELIREGEKLPTLLGAMLYPDLFTWLLDAPLVTFSQPPASSDPSPSGDPREEPEKESSPSPDHLPSDNELSQLLSP